MKKKEEKKELVGCLAWVAE
jgi:hypothetical protein